MSSDKPRFVFILGMHRSGTSCLTGALAATGLFLGKISKGNMDNPRGNYENRSVQKLNDLILDYNHGGWSKPPDSLVITEEYQKAIKEYLSSFGSESLIGIKDPRIVLLADAWLSSAKSFQLIGSFRHPMAVAMSLQKRDSLPIEQGLQLWIQYNERLLKLHRAYNFPIVEYDLSNYDEYCENIGNLAAEIGLNKNIDGIRRFVISTLQTARPASNEVPDQCRELYSNLKRIRYFKVPTENEWARPVTNVPGDKKFVFICGLHKSGTSILFRSLRQHPMISGFAKTGVPEDEGQLLQSVFPPAKAYGGPGRFGFNPDSYLDERSSIVTEENAKQLFADWSRYWDTSKPVLLEKSPPNVVRTRFLQALFPNSFFVVILRHPVAVAYATQKWRPKDVEFLLRHWLVCHERFEADMI